ncbi:hypothetical protein HS048_04890 [Planomonospora sp. ID91781]|uniref:hypothetical protein n=1 Tax=Planomonospora sp. ID91781 TaxID=2738135 RepID=UPI0018C3E1E1|nr:hypothetical protein [Planomonospora sp. ID91781]MBG0820074.1 hypothetical protein [Planomonospora sp. ID91781]
MNVRTAFVAAPLLVFAYGVIRILDGLDGSRGPGLAWTAGHLAFLAALALFVPIFWEMRRMAGRKAVATVSAALGTAGLLALTAQFAIDIVIGFMSADHDAMGVLFDRVQAVPGVSFVVYDGVPLLFFAAQFALVLQLAVAGRVRAWTPVLVMADLLLPFFEKDLIPLGALFLLVSFAPLARRSVAAVSTAPTTPAAAVSR